MSLDGKARSLSSQKAADRLREGRPLSGPPETVLNDMIRVLGVEEVVKMLRDYQQLQNLYRGKAVTNAPQDSLTHGFLMNWREDT